MTERISPQLCTKRIIVHGKVQGVGFRYFTRDVGKILGLTGDARNLPDRTVEIIVEGNAEKIADFIEEVKRGPVLARVDHVDVEDIPARGGYHSFTIEGR